MGIKIEKYENNDEWLEARKGRITGTRAGGLVSKRDRKPLKGFYEMVAERIAIPADGENVMDRGIRLEEEAIQRFVQETGKKVNTDLVIISREDDPNIAYSPDGYIGKTEDVEVKCLNTAAHIEAWVTKEIPSEYEAQIVQGFVVNDNLKTRYMVFYDPRMPKCDFFYLTINREDMEEKITDFIEMERRVLNQIAEIEVLLTF